MLVKERNLRKLLLLVGILMMAVAFTGCQQTPLQVTIPDSALEVALRNALNKPEGPIYKSDLESLTALNIVGKNISDISALSGLTNLEWLVLPSSRI
jgi:internalin A